MNITKEELPKGLSWPLQTSALASALEHAGITIDCSVNYTRSAGGTLTAHFWPPNPNVDYERVYLTVGAVPSAAAQSEREHMSDRVLPSFVSWLKAIIAQSPDSPIRREKQIFFGSAI